MKGLKMLTIKEIISRCEERLLFEDILELRIVANYIKALELQNSVLREIIEKNKKGEEISEGLTKAIESTKKI